MTKVFEADGVRHFAARPRSGNSAFIVLTPLDFESAWQEITDWEGYSPTPLHALPALAERVGVAAIYYKDEAGRFSLASFKALGAAYAAFRLLRSELSRRLNKPISVKDIRKGKYRQHCSHIVLVSATDGNHGRSLAWGAQKCGARCRIYIHSEVSEGRAQAIREFGAEVVRIRGDYDDSVASAKRDALQNGSFLVLDTSYPGYTERPRDVMAGYGVMADEIVQALPEAPTHVFLQAGVGGLAASVAARLRQLWGDKSPRVVVVEPDFAPCFFESQKAGAAMTVKIEQETIMAGLSCGEPSALAWEILAEEASDYLTISDDLVPPTVRLLARPYVADPKIEAGESGVAGLAALLAARGDRQLSEKLGLDESSRVLLIGSEGVTDPAVFLRIMKARDAA